MTKSEYQELVEDTRDRVRIVAEGVTTVDRKLGEFRSEVADSFREHRDLLRNSYRDLDLGMTSVEERPRSRLTCSAS